MSDPRIITDAWGIEKLIMLAIAEGGWRNGYLRYMAAACVKDPRLALKYLSPIWLKKAKDKKRFWLDDSLLQYLVEPND